MAKKTISTPVVEAPVEQNGVFMNNIKADLVRDASAVNEKGETVTFKSISFPVPETISANGWASITVPTGLVYAAKNYQTKEDLAGYVNVLLGKPEGERQVSVCTALPTLYKNGKVKTPAQYEKQSFTNAEIAEMYRTNKAQYKKAARAAAKAEAEIG